jgi:hypothetical protein
VNQHIVIQNYVKLVLNRLQEKLLQINPKKKINYNKVKFFNIIIIIKLNAINKYFIMLKSIEYKFIRTKVTTINFLLN